MEVPDFWARPDAAQALIEEQKSLRVLVRPVHELRGALKDRLELLELADPAADGQVILEIEEAVPGLVRDLAQVERRTLYRGGDDLRAAVLTIQAGAGGVDAMDWALQLERMYLRWLAKEGLEAQITDRLEGASAGIHHSEISVSGLYAYGRLRGERGVHRICHISDFDANKKKQTSFAAVDVVPVHSEVAVELLERDLEVETFCSGGPGGQNVNKVASAVRIRHLPSGLMVKCQSHRSQLDNKRTALEILASKLRRHEEDRRERRPKLEASFGHQTRTYVIEPYQLVKDHRSGHETGNARAVLDGDLNGFQEAYLMM